MIKEIVKECYCVTNAKVASGPSSLGRFSEGGHFSLAHHCLREFEAAFRCRNRNRHFSSSS